MAAGTKAKAPAAPTAPAAAPPPAPAPAPAGTKEKAMGVLEVVQPELIPVIEAAKAKKKQEEGAKAKAAAKEAAQKAEAAPPPAPTPTPAPTPAAAAPAGPGRWKTVAAGAAGFAAGAAAKATPTAQTTFFLLGGLLHLLDMYFGFGNRTFRAAAYFVILPLAGWAFGFLPKGESPISYDGLTKILPWSFCFGALAWGWPWLLDKLFTFLRISFTLKNIFLVFFPLIVFFFLIHPEIAKANKFLLGVRYVYLGAFIAIVLYYLLGSTVIAAERFGPGAIPVEGMTAAKDVYELLKEVTIGIAKATAKFVLATVKAIFGVGVEFVEEQKRIALGPYYQGRIDEKADKKLGVRLQKIRKIGEPYFTNLPVVLQTPLTAETTADAPVDIKFWCRVQEKKDEPWIQGIVSPTELAKVIGRRSDVVNCRFDENTLPAGTLRVEMGAQFNFRTDTDFTTYLISNEGYNALVAQNKDFFQEYSLKKIPVRSSPGPVNIKISFGEQPRILDIDRPRSYPMGIRIERVREWPGKVVKMNRLILVTPKGVTMEAAYGAKILKGTEAIPTETFSQISCAEAGEAEYGCDDAISNLYQINVGAPEEIKDKPKDFAVDLKIDSPLQLLGDGPYAIKSFGVISDYDYANVQKVKIKVTEMEE